MKTFLPILLAGILISSSPLYPSTIKTPTDLGNWLKSNFTYKDEIEDYWQSSEETVKLKTGDCDDLMILSDKILTDLGYDSTKLAIYFSEGSGHGVTLLKIDGYYTLFSNTQYLSKKFKSFGVMLNYYFPTWNKVYVIIGKKKGILIGER